MEQKKQTFLIRPRRVLLLGVVFTALLLLGLFSLTFSAFIILPKWIRLPAFVGFLKKSQIKYMASTEHQQAIEKMKTLFMNSSVDPKPLNPSLEREIVLTRNFSSFRDMGNTPNQEKASPPVEKHGDNSPKFPIHSPLVTVNASVIASASAPFSMGINGSNTAPLKQNIESGKVAVRGDAALEVAPSPKGNEGLTACNIFDGKWAFDSSYPLYRTRSCSFIDEAFDCEGNGRKDLGYMKWRWQPRDCNLPRFNATNMLEQLRGKRLVFVGDSINRNQWESMLCLLSEAVPDKRRVYETHGRKITKGKGLYTFMFMDYHCTIEFYVTHFLVQEGKARIGRKRRPTLRIDKIDKTSSKWKGADILIFNSAHWWTHSKTAEGVNYYQEGDQVLPRLDVLTAFRRALMTWASWLDTHIDSRKTQVFFRSYSPSHFWGGKWNSGGRCEGESQSIFNETLLGHYPEQMRIVEEVIEQMKTPVTFLNVTRLSEFRKDGHPSVYGRRLVDKKMLNSRGIPQDCSHWCLPGVPDSWNELFYALFLKK